MKLTIGSIYLGKDEPNLAELSNEQDVVKQISLEDENSSVADFAPYLDQVDEVVVGWVNQPDLAFLQSFPNVTDVWIITSTVKNLDGLLYLKNLRSFAIDRPTCRMDVLGELSSLRKIYLDDWRPGAKSIFRLKNLVKVGIQKYGYPNLQEMSHWTKLEELWLNAGKLETLDGIPSNLKKLRLTSLRKFYSISELSNCLQLEGFALSGCRKVNSLEGLENCLQLKGIGITKGGIIESLEPLRGLKNLEFIAIADGTNYQGHGVDVLYELPKLQRVVITKKSGVEKEKILKVAPNCKIILAR